MKISTIYLKNIRRRIGNDFSKIRYHDLFKIVVILPRLGTNTVRKSKTRFSITMLTKWALVTLILILTTLERFNESFHFTRSQRRPNVVLIMIAKLILPSIGRTFSIKYSV